MARWNLELVGDVVQDVVAVVDDVCLMNREHRAWGELRISRQVPMGEQGDKLGYPLEVGSAEPLSGRTARGLNAP